MGMFTDLTKGEKLIVGFCSLALVVFVLFRYNSANDTDAEMSGALLKDGKATHEPKYEQKDINMLPKRLAYLNEIPDVAWVEFEQNNVYIGFRRVPSDLRNIVNGAAFAGNKEIDGVHVWAVPEDQRGFKPGSGPYICSATARYGKVQKNNCE